MHSPGKCNNCSQGFYNDVKSYGSFCKPCEKGKYQNSKNGYNKKCILCPHGKFGNVVQAMSESSGCFGSCKPGYYGDTRGNELESNACKRCPTGTYSLDNFTHCKKCPLGTFHLFEGATYKENCTKWHACPPGYKIDFYGSYNSDRTCIKCTPGRYQDKKDMFDCVNCQIGKYLNFFGANTPENCTVSVTCDPGTYIVKESTATTPRQCEKCEPGRYQEKENTFDCVDCPVGRYNNVSGAHHMESNCSQYTNCPPGKYIAVKGTLHKDRTCLPCPHGKFVPTDNVNRCITWKSCYASTSYVDQDGSAFTDRICKECLNGQYTTGDNIYKCTLPAMDGVSPASCKDVDGKYYYNHGTGTCKQCTSCNQGKYLFLRCASARNTICLPCPSGTYQPLDIFLGLSCQNCPYGKHGTEEGKATEVTACVTNPPSQALNLNIESKTATMIRVSWSPPTFDGGDRVQYVVSINITRKVTTTKITNLNSITFDTGLRPTTAYIITLVCKNKYGSGAPSKFTVVTLAMSKPEKPQFSFEEPIEFRANSFRFFWKETPSALSDTSYYEYQLISDDEVEKFVFDGNGPSAGHCTNTLTDNAKDSGAVSAPSSSWIKLSDTTSAIVAKKETHTVNKRLNFRVRAVNIYRNNDDDVHGRPKFTVGEILEIPFVVEPPSTHTDVLQVASASTADGAAKNTEAGKIFIETSSLPLALSKCNNNSNTNNTCLKLSDPAIWEQLNQTGHTLYFNDMNGVYEFSNIYIPTPQLTLRSDNNATLHCINGPCIISKQPGTDTAGMFPKLFKGFYINGKAEELLYGSERGGCMRIEDIKYALTLENLYFFNCRANEYGGALYISNARYVYIKNVTITKTTSKIFGGGIYIEENSHVQIVLSSLFNNYARKGGAIAIANRATVTASPGKASTTVTILESRISNNTVETNGNEVSYALQDGTGGGIYLNNAKLQLKDVVVENNEAAKYGGAVYTLNGMLYVDNSFIRSNTVPGGGGGGGLASWDSSVTIVQSNIVSNFILGVNSHGGGGWFAASSIVNIQNTNVTNNIATSGHGGGMYISHSSIMFSGRVLNNKAGRNGGGMECNQCNKFQIENSIFLKNLATADGGCLDLTDMETKSSSIIRSTLFDSCASIDGNGGAVAVVNTNRISIELSTFSLNTANNGGGGGIFWTHFEMNNNQFMVPTIIINSNNDGTNNAKYGPFIATPAYSIFSMNGPSINATVADNLVGNNQILLKKYNQHHLLAPLKSKVSRWDGVKSGSIVTKDIPNKSPQFVAVAFLDYYDQIVANFNGRVELHVPSSVVAKIDSVDLLTNTNTDQAPTLQGEFSYAFNGVATFHKLIVGNVMPNRNVQLTSHANGIRFLKGVLKYEFTVGSCLDGEYLDLNTKLCLKCKPGSYLKKEKENILVTECIACPPGTYQEKKGGDVCLKCPSNTFNEIAGAYSIQSCLRCPDLNSGTRGEVGQPTNKSCICNNGFFPMSEACHPCPYGAVCNWPLPFNGSSQLVGNWIKSEYGFWQIPFDWGVDGNNIPLDEHFVKCPKENVCIQNSTCADGYAGVLCQSCISGYRMNTLGDCVSCSNPGGLSMIAIGIFGFIFILFLFSVIFSVNKHLKKPNLFLTTLIHFGELTKIAVDFLQIAAVLPLLLPRKTLPGNFMQFSSNLYEFIYLDIASIMNLRCISNANYADIFRVNILTIMALIFVVGFCVFFLSICLSKLALHNISEVKRINIVNQIAHRIFQRMDDEDRKLGEKKEDGIIDVEAAMEFFKLFKQTRKRLKEKGGKIFQGLTEVDRKDFSGTVLSIKDAHTDIIRWWYAKLSTMYSLKALVTLLLLFHTTASHAVFKYFNCNVVYKHHSYLEIDYTMACYGNSLWNKSLPLVSMFGLIMIAGFPFYYCVSYFWVASRKRLHTHSMWTQSHSVLHSNFSRRNEWWEIFEMARKFLLAAGLIYLKKQRYVQAVMGLLIASLSLGLLASRRPYRNQTALFLKQLEYVLIILLLLCSFLNGEQMFSGMIGNTFGFTMILITMSVPCLIPLLLLSFWRTAKKVHKKNQQLTRVTPSLLNKDRGAWRKEMKKRSEEGNGASSGGLKEIAWGYHAHDNETVAKPKPPKTDARFFEYKLALKSGTRKINVETAGDFQKRVLMIAEKNIGSLSADVGKAQNALNNFKMKLLKELQNSCKHVQVSPLQSALDKIGQTIQNGFSFSKEDLDKIEAAKIQLINNQNDIQACKSQLSKHALNISATTLATFDAYLKGIEKLNVKSIQLEIENAQTVVNEFVANLFNSLNGNSTSTASEALEQLDLAMQNGFNFGAEQMKLIDSARKQSKEANARLELGKKIGTFKQKINDGVQNLSPATMGPLLKEISSIASYELEEMDSILKIGEDAVENLHHKMLIELQEAIKNKKKEIPNALQQVNLALKGGYKFSETDENVINEGETMIALNKKEVASAKNNIKATLNGKGQKLLTYENIGEFKQELQNAVDLDAPELTPYINDAQVKIAFMINELITKLKVAYKQRNIENAEASMKFIESAKASKYVFNDDENKWINKVNCLIVTTKLENFTATLSPSTVGKLQKLILFAATIKDTKKTLAPLIKKAEKSIMQLEQHIVSKIEHACVVLTPDQFLVLQDALTDAEIAVKTGFKFTSKDKKIFDDAENMLNTLEHEWKQREDLLKDIRNGLDKLGKINEPPDEVVKLCLQTILTLLDYEEKDFTNWEEISNILMNDEFESKLENLALGVILQHVTDKAKSYLIQIDKNDIKSASASMPIVLKLYTWVCSCIMHLDYRVGK